MGARHKRRQRLEQTQTSRSPVGQLAGSPDPLIQAAGRDCFRRRKSIGPSSNLLAQLILHCARRPRCAGLSAWPRARRARPAWLAGLACVSSSRAERASKFICSPGAIGAKMVRVAPVCRRRLTAGRECVGKPPDCCCATTIRQAGRKLARALARPSAAGQVALRRRTRPPGGLAKQIHSFECVVASVGTHAWPDLWLDKRANQREPRRLAPV